MKVRQSEITKGMWFIHTNSGDIVRVYYNQDKAIAGMAKLEKLIYDDNTRNHWLIEKD